MLILALVEKGFKGFLIGWRILDGGLKRFERG
jgi:hypothetical protein